MIYAIDSGTALYNSLPDKLKHRGLGFSLQM